MNSEEREASLGEIQYLITNAQSELAKAEVCEDCGCGYFAAARNSLAHAAIILDSLFGEPVVPGIGEHALS